MSSPGYQFQLEDRFRVRLAASWMRASVEELAVGGTGLLEERHAPFLEEATGADLAKGQEVIETS